MDSKKINQLATNVAPSIYDLTVVGDATSGELKKITLNQIASLFGSVGGVSSVAMTVPTGLSISGSPITTSGTFAVTLTAGYSIPTTAKQTEWDAGYAERLKWDGGASGLVASTARASLGLVIGTDVLAYRTFGTAANNNTGDFATAAQGTNADTAYSLRLTGASLPLSISGNIISIAESSTTISGFLSSTNFNVFNGKQAALNGTGFVKASGTTISYDNSTYALDNAVVHLIGTETIGGTKTFSDTIKNNGGIFLQNASSNSLAGYMNLGGLTNGVRFTSGGGIANYFTLPSATGYTYTFPNATGTIALTSDIPILTGYVPYTGATANVDLGTFNLTADVITGATGSFTSNGGSDTFAINHSSGAGIALNITKGGNGEGLYINKTSGSGNAATIIGTLNATTLVKSGGTSSQFLKADGTVDSSTYALNSAVVHLAGTETITGAKTFSTFTKFDGGVILKNNVAASLVGYVGLSAFSFSGNKGINIDFDTYSIGFYFNGTLPYNYTFPNANGTIAITSDLSSYLPLAGGTLTGPLNGTSAIFSTTIKTGAPTGGTAKPWKLGSKITTTCIPSSWGDFASWFTGDVIEIEIDGTTYLIPAVVTNYC